MIEIVSKSNYNKIRISGNRLYGMKGFKVEDIIPQIVFVGIDGYEAEGLAKTSLGGIAGGILYGVTGLLTGLAIFKPKIDAHFSLFLKNGDILRVYTDDIKVAKILLPYMDVKEEEVIPRWKP